MFLSGEICLSGDREKPVRLGYTSALALGVAIAPSERTRWQTIAPTGVIQSVSKQKSADGIVCAGQRINQEGSSPSGARIRGTVSEGGGNALLAGV